MSSGEFLANYTLQVPQFKDELLIFADTPPPWAMAPVPEESRTYTRNAQGGSEFLKDISHNRYISNVAACMCPDTSCEGILDQCNKCAWKDMDFMTQMTALESIVMSLRRSQALTSSRVTITELTYDGPVGQQKNLLILNLLRTKKSRCTTRNWA